MQLIVYLKARRIGLNELMVDGVVGDPSAIVRPAAFLEKKVG